MNVPAFVAAKTTGMDLRPEKAIAWTTHLLRQITLTRFRFQMTRYLWYMYYIHFQCSTSTSQISSQTAFKFPVSSSSACSTHLLMASWVSVSFEIWKSICQNLSNDKRITDSLNGQWPYTIGPHR